LDLFRGLTQPMLIVGSKEIMTAGSLVCVCWGRGCLKGRLQVVMNKCFLNPEKNLMQIRLVVFLKSISETVFW